MGKYVKQSAEASQGVAALLRALGQLIATLELQAYALTLSPVATDPSIEELMASKVALKTQNIAGNFLG